MAMIYKTLMLQLYRPSGRKRALIENALLHYSQALQVLMDRYQNQIEELARSKTRVTQQLLLGLIDKTTSDSLNRFAAQPFKDSLKMEFSSLAAAYIGRKLAAGETGYPFTFLELSQYDTAVSDCIDRFDAGQISGKELKKECSKLISRAGKPHSLYFGRYSFTRDYCLLYDEYKDRFYAKLYLLNLADGYLGGDTAVSGLSLRYVAPGMPPLIGKPGKKRYIVTPLAFGKEQYSSLKRALTEPGLLHTAHLVKKENRYYLMVNMACNPGPALETTATMGISRNPSGGLSYTICNNGGAVLEHGRIPPQGGGKQMMYAYSKAVVEIAEKNRCQVILESNGGKNDRMPHCKDPSVCLSCGQYASLDHILSYKLSEKKLPRPVEVSPNGLFCTCPDCQNTTSRNKISEELFICVECGYASESEWIGSDNLAKRLIRYRQDKIPITVSKTEGSLLFRNDSLNFRCLLPQDTNDYRPVYDALNRYVRSFDGKFQSDSKKFNLLKKLRQSPDLRETVKLVFR